MTITVTSKRSGKITLSCNPEGHLYDVLFLHGIEVVLKPVEYEYFTNPSNNSSFIYYVDQGFFTVDISEVEEDVIDNSLQPEKDLPKQKLKESICEHEAVISDEDTQEKPPYTYLEALSPADISKIAFESYGVKMRTQGDSKSMVHKFKIKYEAALKGGKL